MAPDNTLTGKSRPRENELEGRTIFTQSHSLPMDTRETDGGNNNVIVIGSSGSGKTHNFLKPNILQCNTNMVISDAKGTLLRECGHVLEQNGYTIKILNLHDLSKSMRYNPFQYIEREDDIEYLALCMASSMANGKERSAGTGDTYWLEMATILLKALIGAVYYEFPLKERNVDTLLKLFQMAGVERYREESELTVWFQRVRRESRVSYHVRNYQMFESQAGADRAQASCLGVVGSILAQWQLSSVRNLTLYDELELYRFDDRRTALFVLYDDTDPSKNFISNILYSQLFKLLIRKAEQTPEGRLRIPLRFYLDDFANTTIPGFVDMLATIRSREISACVILQSESQLVAKYGVDADSVIENCAAYLFTGTSGTKTAKAVAERFGMEMKEVLHLPKDQFIVYADRQIQTGAKFRPENHRNFREGFYDYEEAIARERQRHPLRSRPFREQIRQYEELLRISQSIVEENRDAQEEERPGAFREVPAGERPGAPQRVPVRKTPFATLEEEMFYSILQGELGGRPDIYVELHVPLKELFETEERGITCDFVLRARENFQLICGIDIRGGGENSQLEHEKEELIKERLFSQNGIRLIQVRPEDFYEPEWDIALVNAIKQFSDALQPGKEG